jgi:hypothetical protein
MRNIVWTNGLLALMLGTALVLAAGCGDGGSSCQPGSEKCSCFMNGTCNAGLTCASNTCVDLMTTPGTGGVGGGGSISQPPSVCGAIAPQCSSIATDATGICIAECCCSQFVACTNSSSCTAILSCGADCTGSACLNSCLSANPAGATAATNLLNCMDANCGTGTGGTTGTGGVTGSGGTFGSTTPQGYCGDGVCNSGETQTSCCQDCGCPSMSQTCLTGQCCSIPAIGGVCGPTCGCAVGSVCYPSTTTHTMVCGVSDNVGLGGACVYNADCASGLGCFGGVCKTYCQTDSDCPAVGGISRCAQTTWGDETGDISGVKVCDRICDPVNPQNPRSPLLACPAGFECDSSSTGVSGCLESGSVPGGSSCAKDGDCLPGYYCNSPDNLCRKFCWTQTDCPAGTTCSPFSPLQYAGTFEVYACSPGAGSGGSGGSGGGAGGTGGGGGAGGSGGGGSGGSCGAIDPRCSSMATDATGICIAECCCSQTVACINSSACTTIMSCGANCTGSACEDSCFSANPAGATAANNVLDCMEAHCN